TTAHQPQLTNHSSPTTAHQPQLSNHSSATAKPKRRFSLVFNFLLKRFHLPSKKSKSFLDDIDEGVTSSSPLESNLTGCIFNGLSSDIPCT
ncbi:MAG: hypothetical protein ABJB16_05090, partial [Saprospiraceae bacterium]